MEHPPTPDPFNTGLRADGHILSSLDMEILSSNDRGTKTEIAKLATFQPTKTNCLRHKGFAFDIPFALLYDIPEEKIKAGRTNQPDDKQALAGTPNPFLSPPSSPTASQLVTTETILHIGIEPLSDHESSRGSEPKEETLSKEDPNALASELLIRPRGGLKHGRSLLPFIARDEEEMGKLNYLDNAEICVLSMYPDKEERAWKEYVAKWEELYGVSYPCQGEQARRVFEHEGKGCE